MSSDTDHQETVKNAIRTANRRVEEFSSWFLMIVMVLGAAAVLGGFDDELGIAGLLMFTALLTSVAYIVIRRPSRS
jgi:hypothetical protein